MVVRSKDWRPLDGEKVSGCSYTVVEGDEVKKCRSNGDSDSQSDQSSQELEKGTMRVTTTSSTESNLDVLLKVQAPYDHRGAKTLLGKWGEFMIYSYRYRPSQLQSQVVNPKEVEVHGLCKLPPGYTLCLVPPHMDVRPRGDSTEEMALSSNFSALQVLWSIAQTIIGCYTLWSARGSQLNMYGYAAFGLTVIPYVIASIVNLLAGLVTRDYNFLYLVHSEIMDEAIARGAVIDGAVGTITPKSGDETGHPLSTEEKGMIGDLTFEFNLIPNREDSYTCERHQPERTSTSLSTATSSTECSSTFTLLPPKDPFANFGSRFGKTRKAFYVMFHSEPKKKKCKEPSEPARTITVPSHGRFKRLPSYKFELPFKVITVLLLMISVAAPYLLIYAMTGYKVQQATSTQTTFTTHWLSLGQSYGLSVAEFERYPKRTTWIVLLIFVVVLYSWAAIGGLVIVAQEMLQFGTCQTL